MEEINIKVEEIEDLTRVTNAVQNWLEKTNVVLLVGELGSGKTTFTKSFCNTLFGHDEASSPTYSLINIYKTGGHKDFDTMAHMDLYRIKSTAEAMDAGVDEYLTDPRTLCFIEWPTLVENLIDACILIKIEVCQNGTRNFVLSLIE